MEFYDTEEHTLRDFLRVIFRYKILIIACSITIFGIVSINLNMQTPRNMASVKMQVVATNVSGTEYYEGLNVRSGQYIAQNKLAQITSRHVIERSVEALRLYDRPVDYEKRFAPRLRRILIERQIRDVKESAEGMSPEQRKAYFFEYWVDILTGSISATTILDTDQLVINAVDFDPKVATMLANSVSRSYLIYEFEQRIAELQLEYGNNYPLVKQLQKYIDKVSESLDGRILPPMEAIGPASIKIIEQARNAVEIGPRGTLAKVPQAAAIFMGVFFGIFLAFIFDFLDHTFKSPSDIKKYLNIPLLGSIPRSRQKESIIITSSDTRVTDYERSYRNLCEHIILLMKEKGFRSLLFTDAEGGEDTSVITANLGLYLSHKAEYKVLIIEANFRNPSLAGILKMSADVGLKDILEQKANFENAIQYLSPNLYIISSGVKRSDKVDHIDFSGMPEIIKKAEEVYDVILINCANTKNYIDAVRLSTAMDGVVYVINERKVRRQVVTEAITPLKEKQVNLAGIIFNNRTYVIPKIIYNYI